MAAAAIGGALVAVSTTATAMVVALCTEPDVDGGARDLPAGIRHTGSMHATTTVLVEGESDRVAVETLALRLGHDLTAERVTVVPMGGATSIVHFLDRYPDAPGNRLLGLCDAGEARGVARALERARIGSGSLAELGFQVCDVDLEDELIRCLGIDAVLNVIEAQGELASFRILQRQPSQRERPVTAQLRRFFGGRSGNKTRYARLLVDALPAGQAPPPLARLVASFSPAAPPQGHHT